LVNESSRTNFILGSLLIIFVSTIIYLLVSFNKTSESSDPLVTNNISEQNGIQYIDLTAKGGYYPNSIEAKANIDTVLRVKTSGTFDCSSAIAIPSLNYRATLPPTGITEIKVPPQITNSTLKGSCSMGMYKFTIKFI
jgi:plastocyanin domain-containing protein